MSRTGRTNALVKGGVDIQGIIEEYTADENISAGDFVEYFNTKIGTDTELKSGDSAGLTISAVALSSTKVFIAHNLGGQLYGLVCDIEGTTITTGTDTQLCSNYYSGETISAVALSSTKVFIAHSYSSNYTLYGTVCTINNSTITVGTNTLLSSNYYGGYYISAVKLADNRIFIAYNTGDYSYYLLYGIVCTISGTDITPRS